MNQPSEKKPVSEFSKRETELTKRANEYLKELSKTQTMSYIDDDGYIVNRSPDGTITRVSSSPVR